MTFPSSRLLLPKAIRFQISYEEEIVHPVSDPSQAEEGDERDDEVSDGLAAANVAQVLECRLDRFGSRRQLLTNLQQNAE